MKVNVEDISRVEKRLQVEIPPEAVARAIDRTCQKLSHRVDLKGFRKGRVPKSVLRRLFKEHVEEEAIELIVRESLPEAIRESGLEPILRPTVEDYGELREDQAFTYSARVEIRPEFELPREAYVGLEVEKPSEEVSEEEVEEYLEALRYTFAEVKKAPEDHELQERDVAIIAFKAFEGDRPVPGHEAEALYVDVGTGEFDERVEEALLGHKAGEEIEVEVEYPEDALNELLAGKKIRYQVTLREIYVRELAPLDDEFVKKMKLGFESAEHLRQRVRARLEEERRRKAEEKLREDLLSKILEKVDFPVPERYVEFKIAQMLEGIEQDLQQRGHTFESAGISVERLKQRLRPVAERQAREEFVLEKIAEQEGITVSQEELEEKAREMARASGGRPEEALRVIMTYMVPKLLAEKTLEFLVSQARIKNGTAESEKKEEE
ncbi:trigger factor [Thermosulfurimonas marina]|uniref:Trigger factor n=1 Tax=Thermosulfurimonas marina TaxID=2047767 RepID=A0A6H1WRZ1_9BACT|nr:trigger factor [Thermosulfurimonas marina]QJA05963.1 trigger factor [Thermosulfurimonas marina]